jgi:CRP/FNR family transcriptional regulator, dissimilatory nitrate respiration regulator
MNRDIVITALVNSYFFADLDEDMLRLIRSTARSVQQPRGTLIFSEGDECHGMYIARSGAVKIFKEGPDGKEHVLHVAMAGDCFGEAALFLGGGYPASAAAVKDSELVLLRKDPFLKLLSEHPNLAIKVMGSLALWARRLVSKVEILSFQDTSSRLAGYLLSKIPPEQAHKKSGASFDLGVPKQVLAAQLGMSSETLSRLITRFEAEGLIETQGRRFWVLDRDLLRFAAGVDTGPVNGEQ